MLLLQTGIPLQIPTWIGSVTLSQHGGCCFVSHLLQNCYYHTLHCHQHITLIWESSVVNLTLRWPPVGSWVLKRFWESKSGWIGETLRRKKDLKAVNLTVPRCWVSDNLKKGSDLFSQFWNNNLTAQKCTLLKKDTECCWDWVYPPYWQLTIWPCGKVSDDPSVAGGNLIW